ncbi:HPP family protein [Halocalculus aciditolerans]|uniref:Universal stress protein UspA n=1 Tax=Halocalculus aciditolerans TaxID=1383812 RepID=A0A830F8Y3_9EURY|nr:HPP family protein [Halocalculus aciditolerans]GGL51581.1 universal stress protein UspA [Halocalculus aciditolerans]
MLERLRRRCRAECRRAHRLERREARELRRWLEDTSNLTHASVLFFVPLLIGFVTLLSNELQIVSFLLFPPLASGTYTLFADPDGRYADPRKFVGGMSLGAFCGWLAVEATVLVASEPTSAIGVHSWAAALGIFLAGLLTWALDLEVPTAFSTSLLVLLTDPGRFITVLGFGVSTSFLYVVTVAVTTTIIAGVFVVWKREFYEQRARYLYRTTQGDDHVLVPAHGDHVTATGMFAARLAAAHDAGKVVLLDVVDDEARAAADAARALERRADRIETRIGVPCEVVVVVEDGLTGDTVLRTADETNCDLVVTPYEETDDGTITPLVRTLFRSDMDVVAFKSNTERTEWKRVMVPVRRASDIAHAMVDYAQRLAGRSGTVSVCSCIDAESERRDAESMLANLTEIADSRCETRVSRSRIEDFVERNDAHYDLVFVGASTDRTAASRFVFRPTFERIQDVETDVAVVHRGT